MLQKQSRWYSGPGSPSHAHSFPAQSGAQLTETHRAEAWLYTQARARDVHHHCAGDAHATHAQHTQTTHTQCTRTYTTQATHTTDNYLF